MYRRRRPRREIPFSFDSFLDLVANVCGIIIRLILVAWVGARSYHAFTARQIGEASSPSIEQTATKVAAVDLPPITDPLESALQQHRAELARQQNRLLDQLRQFQQLETANASTANQLTLLANTQAAADQQRNQLERLAADRAGAGQSVQLTLAGLESRSKQLAAELRELESLPPLTKTLRYHTPVSKPVHSEELHFECQGGKIAFIDVQAFLVEIRRGLEDKGNLLKTQWEVEGTSSPVGAFRMRYVIERERGSFDAGSLPNAQSSFRYGLSGWVVEPTMPMRGELASEALRPGSEFRRLADALDPEQTVVTMWVYPDSFELYRQLRDFLHERNIEVAGRPLPLGVPIASSRSGSASRGQ